jgi:integrase/recombinase XerD
MMPPETLLASKSQPLLTLLPRRQQLLLVRPLSLSRSVTIASMSNRAQIHRMLSMPNELVTASPQGLARHVSRFIVPAITVDVGDQAAKRFIEFFTATTRNPHTRKAYASATGDFCAWCEQHGLALPAIEPLHVAAYVELITREKSAPTVKQHLAAIRMLFDWLTTGGVIPFNPASSVRGPKFSVKRGKTPVLTAEEARQLLDSINIGTLIGRRYRALIGVMVYSFARVSAALEMRVEDYYLEGRRAWLRLHEKGGKRHEVPAHHNADAYLQAYVEAAGIAGDKKGSLFRSAAGKTQKLTYRPMDPNDALRMIKRRAKAVGLSEAVCNHTFRATGITAFRANGCTLEQAQEIANRARPRTT